MAILGGEGEGKLETCYVSCMTCRMYRGVSDCDLTDITLEGHPFTWIKSIEVDHDVEDRLDRALTNSEWIANFPNVHLVSLIASHSYHSSILLQCELVQRSCNKYSFKFENRWLQEEEIEDIAMNGWMQGDGSDVVQRINSYEGELERWIGLKRRKTKEEITSYMENMETFRSSHDPESVARFFEAQRNYNRVLIQEETFWKQRAKMHWLHDDDLNAK